MILPDPDRLQPCVAQPDAENIDYGASSAGWPRPDMAVLRADLCNPPPLPLVAFGEFWGSWIAKTAKAAACPPDYVAAPLLAAASVLVGNARWVQATPGWVEPPHLWLCVVGDPGSGKSPGADRLIRDVLPTIEARMIGDFPDRLHDWNINVQQNIERKKMWQNKLRAAYRSGTLPPLPPQESMPPEPQSPRLIQTDVTIEKIASLLATAAPKGLLIVRDEIGSWLGRASGVAHGFWLEAFGGRPYRVERQKLATPIKIQRLVVGLFGGTQPQKLAVLLNSVDDGLVARIAWVWPSPIPFQLGKETPDVGLAIEALDRLRMLDLAPDGGPNGAAQPIPIPLASACLPVLEDFGKRMQAEQQVAAGLMVATYGKARGLALRLAIVLEMLRWSGAPGSDPPPLTISFATFQTAVHLMETYFLPMARRVFGASAATQSDRSTAALAKWIIQTCPPDVHVRTLQRQGIRDLQSADQIKLAADWLVDAGWLRDPPVGGGKMGRPRVAYAVNPRLTAAAAAMSR
jgi:hypothetical protein